MTLSKRERVFRTLELGGEPDVVPMFCEGFAKAFLSAKLFLTSEERKNSTTWVQNKNSRVKYLITEQRFWNADIHYMDPFVIKLKDRLIKAPPEYPDCRLNTMNGKIYKTVKQEDTGLDYTWYLGGYFTTSEILRSYWKDYGKPTDLINEKMNYSPKVWEGFVEALSPYFYPMATLPIHPHEDLFEGMTIGRVAYYMRKDPQFIHDIMTEYTNVNIEIVKRLGEAGVDIAFMLDDLGYKEQTIFSHKSLQEFIIPYYKKIYGECKKNGMLIVQHSCGKIDEVLPDLVNAGLNCIEALEPAAGVDLARLKETLGDRLCFMGGMDASRALNFGTPKEVEEEVKRCIKAAAPGGGYFAGPSHTILNMPWKNVLAFRAAIEKYRKYPLNLS